MKKVFYLLLPVLMLTTIQLSGQEKAPVRGEHNKPRYPGRMSMPVYASAAAQPGAPQAAMTPEQRSKFEAAHKRRFEIMVLIGAYKIMPVDQREALKAELLKRIKADFESTMRMQKARIAQAEEELKKLRAELAEKEANSSKLIESELDRLLKMPMPSRRIPRKNKPTTAPNAK